MALLQSKRERTLMGLTALAVLLGGGYFFVFSPFKQMYKDLDDQIATAKKQWEETKDRFVRSKQYRSEFDRIRESLSLEGDEAAQKQRIDQELTKLLDDTGIQPSARLSGNAEQVDDDFKVYSFTLKTIETSWPTLSTFLYKIETNPALLEIKKLDVVQNSTRGAGPNKAVKADIEITRMIEHKISRTKAGKTRVKRRP
jgi:hypothetical protein